MKREVVARNVKVYSKDKKKVYNNKVLYYTNYGNGITGLSVRLAGWHWQVGYNGNGVYQLQKTVER